MSRRLQKEGHFVQAVALGSGARSNRKWLSGRVAEGWQKECRSASPCSKSAAARRALREALVTSPQEISNLIEAAMAGDMTASTPGAGAPQLTSTRAWLEHRSRIHAFPTMVHMSWAIGGALDCLRYQARARLNIAVLMADQDFDRHGELASSPRAESAMSSFRKHEVASSAGDPVYSRLLDPRWAEVALAKLRRQKLWSRLSAPAKDNTRQKGKHPQEGLPRRRRRMHEAAVRTTPNTRLRSPVVVRSGSWEFNDSLSATCRQSPFFISSFCALPGEKTISHTVHLAVSRSFP